MVKRPAHEPFVVGEGETLGERLARLRKERGLTQVELAEELDVIQSIVSDYERNKLRPHPEMITRFAVALGVSADELLGLKLAPKKLRVGSRRWAKRIQKIDSLPKRDQDALLRTIDAFLKGRPS